MWSVVFVAAFVVFALLTAVRWTVLDPAWHQRVLDDVDAYNRVYREVLVDPELAEITDDLLARLPVERSVIDANLRLVVPAATLRETVERASVSLTEYLRKERDDVDADFLLEPLQARLDELHDAFVADVVGQLEPAFVEAFEEFESRFEDLVADVRAGRRPTQFPTITVIDSVVDPLTALILDPAGDVRPALRSQVRAAVAAGDLNGALALAVPKYAQDSPRAAFADLQARAGGLRYDLAADTIEREQDRVLDALRTLREVVGEVLPLVTLLAAAVAAVALAAVVWPYRRSPTALGRVVATTLAGAGGALVGTWLVLRALLGDPFAPATRAASGLPPSVRALLADVGRQARRSFEAAVLDFAVLALVAAGVVATAVWTLPPLVTAVGTVRGRRLVTLAAGTCAVGVLLGSGVLLRSGTTDAAPLVCNGDRDLCDRPLERVVFPMSHNAMASSELGWISANHDLTPRAQLDMGIRGLMLDWWYWDDADRFLELADGADLPDDYVAFLSRILAEDTAVRPGTYLCHAICRLGSTPLVDGLREIRAWLDANPHEVLVMIVQDEIAPEDGVAAMRASGLDSYVYVPARDPEAPWPTLRQLIRTGKRLVFFVERADDPITPWYRNAYDFMMETPFTFRRPDLMSCAPNRGGTDRPLFLMNHWVQRAAPSRIDAGVVNQADAIVARARRCARERGRLPNFVAVDFASVGDVFGAVERLNRLMGRLPSQPPTAPSRNRNMGGST